MHLKKLITNNQNVMEALTVLAVVIAAVKFLFEGGSVTCFGHADASTYGMFLGTVLGAHSYIKTSSNKVEEIKNDNQT